HAEGRPLSAEERAFFEPRFGHDFSRVRIHADASADAAARDVAALAFTYLSDIVFREGQLRTTSTSGRWLLAHELAHVVQQGTATRLSGEPGVHLPQGLGTGLRLAAGPLVQRAQSCSIDHVVRECAGAAGKCAAIQSSYCAKKYPKPEDISTLHENAKAGAESEKNKYPKAAENLLHFLGGTGTEKVMSVDIFKQHSATKDQLTNVHRRKFVEGARKRLKNGELKPGGGPIAMEWTDTANAFSFFNKSDLGLAVGGYTLCSNVKVTASTQSDKTTQIQFIEWNVQAFDCYNWDPGKGIGIPGADDNDLCCLENAGRAKHFRIRTDIWSNDHAPSLAVASL
ncbi:MAG: DUF4157 domain-containing protein, partial [Deltaproteobacteria bacterium]|nr:DUF4157 domain-containing protein [Deltaproteobacteria bacterium]